MLMTMTSNSERSLIDADVTVDPAAGMTDDPQPVSLGAAHDPFDRNKRAPLSKKAVWSLNEHLLEVWRMVLEPFVTMRVLC